MSATVKDYRDLELLGAEERGRRKGFGQGMAAANARRAVDVLDFPDIHADWTDAAKSKAAELSEDQLGSALYGFLLGHLVAHYGERAEVDLPQGYANEVIALGAWLFGMKKKSKT